MRWTDLMITDAPEDDALQKVARRKLGTDKEYTGVRYNPALGGGFRKESSEGSQRCRQHAQVEGEAEDEQRLEERGRHRHPGG